MIWRGTYTGWVLSSSFLRGVSTVHSSTEVLTLLPSIFLFAPLTFLPDHFHFPRCRHLSTSTCRRRDLLGRRHRKQHIFFGPCATIPEWHSFQTANSRYWVSSRSPNARHCRTSRRTILISLVRPVASLNQDSIVSAPLCRARQRDQSGPVLHARHCGGPMCVF